MKNTQSTIIDFGSSKITAVVAEKGINGTFLIKGKYTFPYEGFSEGTFFDVETVKKILFSIAEYVKSALKRKLGTVYVGVPSAFTQVFIKDSQITFDKKKKITPKEIDLLFDSAFYMQSTKYSLINRSAIVYELGDSRKLANPLGESTEILKGKLSFIVCDNYFLDTVGSSLNLAGFNNVEFVSTDFAEALYLIDAEVRDKISIILDVGYITTSFNLIQGDGIVYQKEIPFGGGYITGAISEKLDVDFSVAETLKRKISICREDDTELDVIELDNGDFYKLAEIKDIVISSLNGFCGLIQNAIDESGYEIPEYVPLNITGGGISFIRGAKEYVGNKLNMHVDLLMPKVPMYERATDSSLFSLLFFATEQNI